MSAAESKVVAAEGLAAALPPLLVAAERVAATVSQGVHGRRRVGMGESFWQFRRYQAGDQSSQIDWRQSGKSDRLYVRQTEWEAAQSVWLWRDGSASMDYRSAGTVMTKKETAMLLLLALAALLIRGGERVAILGMPQRTNPGRTTLGQLAASLAQEERLSPAPLPDAVSLPRYGRVVLFGDFLAPLETTRGMVQAMAHGGAFGHLVHIVDPAEEALPFTGRVLFTGSENDGETLVGKVGAVRAAYRAAFDAHRQGLVAIARSVGWQMLTHFTSQPPQLALLALYLSLTETAPPR